MGKEIRAAKRWEKRLFKLPVAKLDRRIPRLRDLPVICSTRTISAIKRATSNRDTFNIDRRHLRNGTLKMLNHRTEHMPANILNLIKDIMSSVRDKIETAILPSVHASLNSWDCDNGVFGATEGQARNIRGLHLRKLFGFLECLK